MTINIHIKCNKHFFFFKHNTLPPHSSSSISSQISDRPGNDRSSQSISFYWRREMTEKKNLKMQLGRHQAHGETPWEASGLCLAERRRRDSWKPFLPLKGPYQMCLSIFACEGSQVWLITSNPYNLVPPLRCELRYYCIDQRPYNKQSNLHTPKKRPLNIHSNNPTKYTYSIHATQHA